MSRRFRISTEVLTLAVAALTGMAFLTSCGDPERSPLVSSADDPAQAVSAPVPPSGGTFSIGFSPRPANDQVLTKPAWVQKRYDTDFVSRGRGGKLKTRFSTWLWDDDDDDVRVDEVEFKVNKKAIDSDRFVTMEVTSGTSLDDVRVKFWPSGVQFEPAAELKIELRGELDKDTLKGLKAYHVEKDGTVTKIKVKVSGRGDKWKLTIKIPGFSYYDLADDEDYADEAGDDW
jgi:hypothetical protein